MSIKEHPPLHVPVLLNDVLTFLDPKKGESYLDLTAGYGGHAQAVLQRTDNYQGTTLVDRDEMAQEYLGRFADKGAELLHTDFFQAATQLVENGRTYSMILLDLGVSSPQLDRAGRGFSFAHDGPLDMRMDTRQPKTAATVVNSMSQDVLSQIIHDYGEEPWSAARRYSTAIIAARPLRTTGELADVIKRAYVGRWRKTHPATRTFQAIRIEVNDELRQIEQVLPLLPKLLKPQGRVGVISFHSLEDRIVKRYFAEQTHSGYEAQLSILTKHPINGSINDVHNPRARSAKLRAAVKKITQTERGERCQFVSQFNIRMKLQK